MARNQGLGTTPCNCTRVPIPKCLQFRARTRELRLSYILRGRASLTDLGLFVKHESSLTH